MRLCRNDLEFAKSLFAFASNKAQANFFVPLGQAVIRVELFSTLGVDHVILGLDAHCFASRVLLRLSTNLHTDVSPDFAVTSLAMLEVSKSVSNLMQDGIVNLSNAVALGQDSGEVNFFELEITSSEHALFTSELKSPIGQTILIHEIQGVIFGKCCVHVGTVAEELGISNKND